MVAADELPYFSPSSDTVARLVAEPLAGYSLALGLFAMIALCLVARGPASRWVRAIVCAVLAQLFAMSLAVLLWLSISPQVDMDTHFPFVRTLPASLVGMSVVLMLITAALPSRSVLPVVRSIVVFLLTHLLVLGLLLPVVARRWPIASGEWVFWYPLIVILASVAISIAMVAIHRVIGNARWSQLAVGAFVVLAVTLMPGEGHPGRFGYSNLAFVLVAESLLVLAGLVSLTILQWRSVRVKRPTAGLREGTVVPDSGEVGGWLQYDGWTRGLRTSTERLRLNTKDGPLEIPAGSRLVLPTPASAPFLEAGEVVAVLMSGERVVVAGFDEASADGPYRGAIAPGSRGLTVWTEGSERRSAMREVLLRVWRPCLLYLAVTTAVALPGVVTAATPYDADRIRLAIVGEPVDWALPEAGALLKRGQLRGECVARARRPRVDLDQSLGSDHLAEELSFAAMCWGFTNAGCPEIWNIVPYTNFADLRVPDSERFELSCANADIPMLRVVELRRGRSRDAVAHPQPPGWWRYGWLSREEQRWQQRVGWRWASDISDAYRGWAEYHGAGPGECPESLPALLGYAIVYEGRDLHLKDPWGNDFRMTCGSGRGRHGYDLKVDSPGPDGRYHTGDEVSDWVVRSRSRY